MTEGTAPITCQPIPLDASSYIAEHVLVIMTGFDERKKVCGYFLKSKDNTVYGEFFGLGNFGKNEAQKVCQIFTESYFRHMYFKDFQWRHILWFIFHCVYIWRFQGGRELGEN